MTKRREDFLRNNLKDSKNAKTNMHTNDHVIAAPNTEPIITNFYGTALTLRTARQIKIDVALHRGKLIPNIF
jgi:methylthioribose-1-phosphate isomerase